MENTTLDLPRPDTPVEPSVMAGGLMGLRNVFLISHRWLEEYAIPTVPLAQRGPLRRVQSALVGAAADLKCAADELDSGA